MKELIGNLWSTLYADAIVITTNGFVTKDGNAVMGRGCALEYTQRNPNAKSTLGKLLSKHGNKVFCLNEDAYPVIVSYPVKPASVINDGTNVVSHALKHYQLGSKVPGFHAKADIEIIKRSAIELSELADHHHWRKVVLPRPGCGAGELTWVAVKYILDPILDDRFYSISPLESNLPF